MRKNKNVKKTKRFIPGMLVGLTVMVWLHGEYCYAIHDIECKQKCRDRVRDCENYYPQGTDDWQFTLGFQKCLSAEDQCFNCCNTGGGKSHCPENTNFACFNSPSKENCPVNIN